MPGRFNIAMTDVTTTVPLLDEGDYVLEFGQVKLFSRDSKDPAKEGQEVYGVQTAIRVIEGPSHVGKTIPQQLFLHSEAALPMVKRTVMAALGFDPNSDDGQTAFNKKFSNDAWICDWDNNAIGEVFTRLAGANVRATVSQKLSAQRDGSEPRMQNQFTWKPL